MRSYLTIWKKKWYHVAIDVIMPLILTISYFISSPPIVFLFLGFYFLAFAFYTYKEGKIKCWVWWAIVVWFLLMVITFLFLIFQDILNQTCLTGIVTSFGMILMCLFLMFYFCLVLSAHWSNRNCFYK
jgi:hypothetical protein